MRSGTSHVININGFALMGMVLSMLLLSVFATGGLVYIRSMGTLHYRMSSSQYLDEVRRSLFIYAKLHGGSLPYADTDGDGWQNNGVPGTGYKGRLPYNSLMIGAGDAWGRNLQYEVNPGLVTDKIPSNFDTMSPLAREPILLEIKNDICAALLAGVSGSPEVWDDDAVVASPFSVAAVIASAGPGDADLDGDVFDAVAGKGSNVTGLPFVRARTDAVFNDLVSYARVQPIADPSSLYGWLAASDTFDWASCQ